MKKPLVVDLLPAAAASLTEEKPLPVIAIDKLNTSADQLDDSNESFDNSRVQFSRKALRKFKELLHLPGRVKKSPQQVVVDDSADPPSSKWTWGRLLFVVLSWIVISTVLIILLARFVITPNFLLPIAIVWALGSGVLGYLLSRISDNIPRTENRTSTLANATALWAGFMLGIFALMTLVLLVFALFCLLLCGLPEGSFS